MAILLDDTGLVWRPRRGSTGQPRSGVAGRIALEGAVGTSWREDREGPRVSFAARREPPVPAGRNPGHLALRPGVERLQSGGHVPAVRRERAWPQGVVAGAV